MLRIKKSWLALLALRLFRELKLHYLFPDYDFHGYSSCLEENAMSNESVQSSY